MSTVQAALEDINWLSKRLKGIITLSEEIKTYDTMKTQTQEFKTQLSTQKTELTKVLQKIKDEQLELAKLAQVQQAAIEIHNKQADSILSKARTDASEVKQKAELEAKSLRDSALQDKLSIEKEIQNSQINLNALSKDIKNGMDYYSKLQQEIAQLKAKF